MTDRAQINVNLTPEQRETLQEAAQAAEMSLAAWCRAMLLAAAGSPLAEQAQAALARSQR